MKHLLTLFTFILFSLASNAQNYQWATAIGDSISIEPDNSIAVDDSGNVYVTGFFQGTADFDPSAATANLTSVTKDIFIAKYDSSGNYIYANTMEGGG